MDKVLKSLCLSALFLSSIVFAQNPKVELRANLKNGAVEYLANDGIWEQMTMGHPIFDHEYNQHTEAVLVEWMSMIQTIYKSPQWACGKQPYGAVVKQPACYNDGPVHIRNILEKYRAECSRECNDCSHLNTEKITAMNDQSCNSAHIYFSH